MHFVILAPHSAEVCPAGNSKIRSMLLEVGPQIPEMAERTGVRLVGGPYVNQEHMTVVILEADRAEDVTAFVAETRLNQWSTVHVIPSKPLADALAEFESQPPLF